MDSVHVWTLSSALTVPSQLSGAGASLTMVPLGAQRGCGEGC